ncbi:hypothetical protein NDU88_004417 [Pleurodeles waltl]|uniref:Uncharacterized protein n=1 Tax=Pleurodeles waltl TaxID=8319 RepID=A0AAV7MWC5_PLEWA|nr:hypothetical protein NDU88_004417 [Pleurodeles waltl]
MPSDSNNTVHQADISGKLRALSPCRAQCLAKQLPSSELLATRYTTHEHVHNFNGEHGGRLKMHGRELSGFWAACRSLDLDHLCLRALEGTELGRALAARSEQLQSRCVGRVSLESMSREPLLALM